MTKFYNEVIKFLQSQYNDDYSFNLTVNRNLSHADNVVLNITVGRIYTITIQNTCMNYIFELYSSGEYIKERCQYRWQKELIDIIEGG